MNAKEIGKRLVQLSNERKNLECVDTYYAEDVESAEAAPMPSGERVSKGRAAVRAKNAWWLENHEIRKGLATGPYPHGDDRFAVRFEYDVTVKQSGQRMQMDEIGVFHVRDGKIVKEEFFYDMG